MTNIALDEGRALALESPEGDPGWFCAECAYAAEGHRYLLTGTVEDLALFLDGDPVRCDGCGSVLLTADEGAEAYRQMGEGDENQEACCDGCTQCQMEGS